MQNIFVARQPVYDRRLEVRAYELLFRARDTDFAEIDRGDEASCEVITNSFLNIGIDNLVGSALAFIKIPEPLILNDTLLPMFHEQTVLELLKDIRPTPEVIEGLVRLKQRGFSLALNYSGYREAHLPLLELIDFAKLDILAFDHESLGEELIRLDKFGIKTVAAKVESQQAYSDCQVLGFDYYQGFFFSPPQTLTKRTVASNKAVVLTLLRQLNDPAIDLSELEATLAADVSLSYKLMRYVNSAAFGLRRQIESLRDAISLVGLNTIRNWASLILLNSVMIDKPQELIRIAMVRARMCELVAKEKQPEIASQMFVTGLFSVIDAIMDVPMVELLDSLALSMPIKLALLEHEGPHGKLLQQVIYYEQAQWEPLLGSGADMDLLQRNYLESTGWADHRMHALQALAA